MGSLGQTRRRRSLDRPGAQRLRATKSLPPGETTEKPVAKTKRSNAAGTQATRMPHSRSRRSFASNLRSHDADGANCSRRSTNDRDQATELCAAVRRRPIPARTRCRAGTRGELPRRAEAHAAKLGAAAWARARRGRRRDRRRRMAGRPADDRPLRRRDSVARHALDPRPGLLQPGNQPLHALLRRADLHRQVPPAARAAVLARRSICFSISARSFRISSRTPPRRSAP